MIVLDANILVRAVLGRRVRTIIDSYVSRGAEMFAPDVAFGDAEKYLPELLRKRGKALVDLPVAIAYVRSVIGGVERDLYGSFEEQARKRLRGRDEEDWPVVASALALGCGVWTEDQDFFGSGIAVWTTSRVEIYLESELRRLNAEED